MKKKYPSYQDAILGQAKDFNLVQETKIADDGSVEVTGWGAGEKEFPSDLGEGEEMLDQLVVRSMIIDDDWIK
jgi:hypothetical protein